MPQSLQISLPEARRLGRVALTALMIGIGAAAVAALPLDNFAFAGNGNGNGGGNGGGNGNGGGHGHDGGNGGGNGHGGGNGGNAGGNAGGSGNGNGNAGNSGANHGGQGSSANAGNSGSGETASDDSGGDDSLSSRNLGKLNGFFHASPTGLANASPNSAIGRISHTFKDALSDFAKADAEDTDDDSTAPNGPSVQDLGEILAGATNRTVTAAQVKAVIDRLADQNPDDAALNDLADTVDPSTCQDIADAANGVSDDGSGTDDTSAVVTVN